MFGRHKDADPPEAVRAALARASRILLIRLRSLGDSILLLPLLEALKVWRPTLSIDVLCETTFSEVFAHHPAVSDLVTIRPRNSSTSQGWSRTRATIEIRRRHYSAVMNLHGGTTSAFMTAASGARWRVGLAGFRNSWAYNALVPDSSKIWGRSALHTVEHQLTLLRWLEIPIPDPARVSIHINPQMRKSVGSRLEAAGLRSSRYVLIQPTATLFTKQWNERRFAQLADQLHRRYSFPLIFTAAAPEEHILSTIKTYAAERHHYWSDLSLGELFALVDGCRLFVGNDSGPTHAAAAMTKPVVVVWGSSDHVAWHPWLTDHELIRSDLPCMPCPGYSCEVFGEPRCIMEIGVATVLEACERILRKTNQQEV